MASGDENGFIKLFNYPSTAPNSGYVKCVGHSSHVKNLKFMKASNHLISVGGNDKSIF
jgi:WD40 repeat protein